MGEPDWEAGSACGEAWGLARERGRALIVCMSSRGVRLGVRRGMGLGSGSSEAVSDTAEDVAMPLPLLVLPL